MRRSLGSVVGLLAAVVLAGSASASDHCATTIETFPDFPRLYQVHGTGFGPRESLKWDVLVDGELVPEFSLERATDAQGRFSQGWVFEPAEAYGTYTFRMSTESCTAEVDLEWLPDTASVTETVASPAGSDGVVLGILGFLVLTVVFIRVIPSRTTAT